MLAYNICGNGCRLLTYTVVIVNLSRAQAKGRKDVTKQKTRRTSTVREESPAVRVGDVGERALISVIHRLQAIVPMGYLGIGDDAAYLPPSAAGWLVSQDMLVEGVHFRWEWMTPEQLGEKAVAVNISDIAAMGGVPKAILTSIALPGSMEVETVERLYRGMAKALDRYGSVLLGGDTVHSPNGLSLDVSVFGQPGPHGPVLLNGAKPGDRLFVTGRLGAAYAGYILLSHGVRWPSTSIQHRSVLQAHLAPVARVEAGQQLGSLAHAMTDISDGLYRELRTMTRFGGIGVQIDAERIPVDAATRSVAAEYGHDPVDFALYGGEDYELLAAVPPSKAGAAALLCLQCGVPVTEIGVVTDTLGIRVMRGGEEVAVDERKSYHHFAVDPD